MYDKIYKILHFVKVNNKNTFIWENNEPRVLKTCLKEHDTNQQISLSNFKLTSHKRQNHYGLINKIIKQNKLKPPEENFQAINHVQTFLIHNSKKNFFKKKEKNLKNVIYSNERVLLFLLECCILIIFLWVHFREFYRD